MKILKKLIILLFLLLITFVLYTMISTGFFRKIEAFFDGDLVAEVSLKGAEDIMISEADSFAIISATDRSIDKTSEQNGLYLIDLKETGYQTIHLSADIDFEFNPHGISYFKKDSIYHIKAINHVGDNHAIEYFHLITDTLIHVNTLSDSLMISPNDLVMIDENQFYFTNDHNAISGFGRFLEDYLGFARSTVVYFDGTDYKLVADGIAYANGINIDQERKLCFVASPRDFLTKVYSINNDGSLAFIEDIDCGTGVDNIEFDDENNLWIGCHPNLLHFSSYAKGGKEISPSEILKINYKNPGDYDIEIVYLNEGEEVSGSTVAATFKDLIFVGNVKDEKFVVLRSNK